MKNDSPGWDRGFIEFSSLQSIFQWSFAGDKGSHRKQGFCVQSQRMNCKDCWGKQNYYPGREENSAENKHGFFIWDSSSNLSKIWLQPSRWGWKWGKSAIKWALVTLKKPACSKTHKILPASPSAHIQLCVAFNKYRMVFRSTWLRQ